MNISNSRQFIPIGVTKQDAVMLGITPCYYPQMQVSIFRDLSAIRFVRCHAQLPNQNAGAGGAGFTLAGALARCQSEYVERVFFNDILKPNNIYPEGIAAHPTSREAATGSAYFEALETFYLQTIKRDGQIEALRVLKLGKFEIHLKPLDIGSIAFIRCQYQGIPMLFYSLRASPISALLKVWEEYRNPHFYKISKELISNYTKAQKILGPDLIPQIEFLNNYRVTKALATDQFISNYAQFMGHHISYLIRGEKNEII